MSTPASPLNGSVERLAIALRGVITESVEDAVESKVAPLRKEVAQQGQILHQHGMLLRGIDRAVLPPEAVAACDSMEEGQPEASKEEEPHP